MLTFLHIEDKEKALRNIHLSLKDQGAFILSVIRDEEWLVYGSRKIQLYPLKVDEYIFHGGGRRFVNKKKIRLILSSMMIGLAGWFAFYTYAEFNGYPWKHAEVKREAVPYMKAKYNMDVAVAGSSYGFKFRDYTAKVFNIHDTEKRIIDVTMHAFYDRANQGRAEMLEDNYSMVYWEQRVDDELRKRYPRLYEQEDIESIAVTTTYSMMPIDSGTSPAADDNDVAIPLEPKHEYTLDMRLRTDSISEALWQELHAVVPDLAAAPWEVNIFVRGRDMNPKEGSLGTEGMHKTMVLSLPYDMLEHIASDEDMKKEVREY